jgi:hypothetical protein
METPVLYFYAPADTRVNVSVRFPQGLMTEWYPHAAVTQPRVSAGTLGANNTSSTIAWQNVTIAPRDRGTPPGDEGASHYYAARATEASLLRVNGQYEKFLFYRGVGAFDVPLTAVAQADGGARVTNLSSRALPAVVLFEKRGESLGYRVLTDVRGTATLDAPTLGVQPSRLYAELEHLLVGAGLFEREAAAMVNTWRDTWFEDGTRVFYILPTADVDAALPLHVDPAPARVARVFVGRMELLTTSAQHAVAQAIARNDQASLEARGRFLGPIADRLLATAGRADSAKIREVTGRAWEAYLRRAAVCE